MIDKYGQTTKLSSKENQKFTKYSGWVSFTRQHFKSTFLKNVYLPGLDFLDTSQADFENALLQTKFGKFHVYITLACGLIYMNTAMGITLLSFVLPAATCDFNMNSQDKAWMNASPMLGMIFGSFFWGCLADTKGRKIVLVLTLLGDGLFGLASSVTPWFIAFLILRFFNGFK